MPMAYRENREGGGNRRRGYDAGGAWDQARYPPWGGEGSGSYQRGGRGGDWPDVRSDRQQWQGRREQQEYQEPDEPPQRRLQGYIKYFDDAKGYGFISSQEASYDYGCDVFLHQRQLSGFGVGDQVSFSLHMNAKGKPQAQDLQAIADQQESPAALETDPLMKTVRAAFIRHSAQGNDGDPSSPAEMPPATPAAASIAAEQSASSRERPVQGPVHQGVIKTFDSAKGYGFIRSQEAFDQYGQDVFLHPKQANGFTQGDRVSFTVVLNNRGQPQAMNLSVGESPDPPQVASAKRLSRSRSDNECDGDGGGDDVSPEGEDNPIVHRGVIKYIDAERGFGFITCPELLAIYENDVYVAQKQVKGFEVGKHVRFQIRANKKGQPQAVDLMPNDSAPEADAANAEEGEPRFVGTIKSFSPEHGYGFISCSEAFEKYTRDVFLHLKQVEDFQPGDHVAFTVRINGQGHPQAYDLRSAPKSVAWLSAMDSELPSATEKEDYVGEIKSFNTQQGYGFIHCAPLRAKYQRDVFIHQLQLKDFKVGDRVSFHVQVKRGQPQAHDVVKTNADLSPGPPGETEEGDGDGGEAAEGADPSSPSSAPAAAPARKGSVDEFAGLDQEALSRKLLRACASARIESTTAMQELLAHRADPNIRDVTGQTPLMIAALNVRHSERKCRLLIENSADVSAQYNDSLTVLQWSKERINSRFAAYLETLSTGGDVGEYFTACDAPRDND
mmetsp:Transcript_128668/g.274639  ORF Transcript_128668/g.274639 Transcript_128668/m.274639 type:complete len:727 (-) Transcript_128668:98-2278(-)